MLNILEKNLLILASAGSGKTYQLGNRIIGRIACGADPERIVALTFTRKAASEFADSMLTKLAQAAADEGVAAQLRRDLGLSEVDFLEVLADLTRSLHRMTLGTIDSFFAKVVRGFQYELGLTGGRFELLEGAQAEIVSDEILSLILGEVMADERGEEFCHAFRRASIGKEQQGIHKGLRDFIRHWHRRLLQDPKCEWGPDMLRGVASELWEERKHGLVEQALAGMNDIEFTQNRQRPALEACLTALHDHTIGSGSLQKMSSLMSQLFEQAVESADGGLELSYYKKPFRVDGPAAAAMRELPRLAAGCELAAAVQRTRAIREVVLAYDRECSVRLRQQGKLSFDDVKLLMGQWAESEQGRLRREAVDFRLDSRIDHWLLDEFQDTSRADWRGLLPLVNEAVSDDDGSVFIVGDRKQSIYGWRGGDVGLFDDVIARYGRGIEIESLSDSWRSCPEVLDLVNRVCSDEKLVHRLFGTTTPAWSCPDHTAARSIRGHSRVEVLGAEDDKVDRLESLLDSLGVGQRDMTCGILFRGNKKAREVANELRARGFDVIYEGKREPGLDSPVGIAVTQLLKWLADPANDYSRGALDMSPLAGGLHELHGASWRDIWNGLTGDIAANGYRAAVARLLAASAIEWSDFGRRRADDVLGALARFDHQGGVSAGQAAALIERLELPQPPGSAAVQVMTIHKSKGLGFDVVILPEIPTEVIPSAKHFHVAEGDHWVVEPPPQWARAFSPELQAAEERWGNGQKYDALCTLYVALTRAKRGLYVLLDAPSKSHDFDKPSLANWMFHATRTPDDGPVLHDAGDPDWAEDLPAAEAAAEQAPASRLNMEAARPVPAAVSPSRTALHGASSLKGMQFGTEVHALLEQVGWVDEQEPDLPPTDAGRAVRDLLSDPTTRALFERRGRPIRLHREQPADALVDGRWITGVIDRLHLHADPQGKVTAAEIIDFKTDAGSDAAELAGRHRAQFAAYRQCIEALHPGADVTCTLLSTALLQRIEID